MEHDHNLRPHIFTNLSHHILMLRNFENHHKDKNPKWAACSYSIINWR